MLVTTEFTPHPQYMYCFEKKTPKFPRCIKNLIANDVQHLSKQLSRNSLVKTAKKLVLKLAVLTSQHDKKLKQTWKKIDILANRRGCSAPRLAKMI